MIPSVQMKKYKQGSKEVGNKNSQSYHMLQKNESRVSFEKKAVSEKKFWQRKPDCNGLNNH